MHLPTEKMWNTSPPLEVFKARLDGSLGNLVLGHQGGVPALVRGLGTQLSLRYLPNQTIL